MPLPIIGAVVVGTTVAAVSYLGPLIIACFVGAATSITSFLVARKWYKRNEKTELSETRKEHVKREKKLRTDAEKIAQRVGDNVELILDRSKQQQQQLGSSIQTFGASIEATNQATENLERVAESMQYVASSTSITVETMSAELDRLKSELISVNTMLQGTQNALVEKERELTLTIEKLATIEAKINEDAHENKLRIDQFSEEFSDASHLLHKDAEMASLREKNIRMTSTIKTLETTIERLTSKFTGSHDLNKSRLGEIQILLTENKRLTGLIDHLSKALEEQDTPISNHRSPTNKMKMFN
ncbi:MAG: hypothetical protein Q8R24_05270 [Legionellaceae bacterium]|nr:hypothetical protein [Legionellaceae bacterium]